MSDLKKSPSENNIESFISELYLNLLIEPLSKIFRSLDSSGGVEIRSLIWIARLGIVNPSQLADLIGVKNKTWFNKLLLGDEKAGYEGFFKKLEKEEILTIIRKGGEKREESWICFSPRYLLLKSIFFNLSFHHPFKPKCNEYRLKEILKSINDHHFMLRQ